jgi:hypothetical protein
MRAAAEAEAAVLVAGAAVLVTAAGRVIISNASYCRNDGKAGFQLSHF